MAARQGNLDRVKYPVDQGDDDDGVNILSRLSPGLIRPAQWVTLAHLYIHWWFGYEFPAVYTPAFNWSESGIKARIKALESTHAMIGQLFQLCTMGKATQEKYTVNAIDENWFGHPDRKHELDCMKEDFSLEWFSRVLETRLRGLSLVGPDSHTKSGRESGDTRHIELVLIGHEISVGDTWP